jgi:hypothetical protein
MSSTRYDNDSLELTHSNIMWDGAHLSIGHASRDFIHQPDLGRDTNYDVYTSLSHPLEKPQLPS